jgi:FkbM family methyltransferase
MFYIINKNELNQNSSKIKFFIKYIVNFLFRFKFFRVNFFYLLPNYKFFKNLSSLKLDKNSTIIDLGANVGNVALYLSDIFGSKIYCYEPNPNCFNYLKKIFKRKKNITIYNKGASNNSRSQKLYFSENDKYKTFFFDGSSYDKEKGNICTSNFLTTKNENINKILSRHKSIDLLKIDIEGWEYKIIKAVIQNLYKIKVVYVELHESSPKQKILYSQTLQLLKKKKLLGKKVFLWI